MVYEHNFDEEIEKEIEEAKEEILSLVSYEVYNSWWAGRIDTKWMDKFTRWHYVRKVTKKWKTWKIREAEAKNESKT